MADKLYNAKGREVWKAPVKTKTENSTSFEVGFHVLTVSDYIGDEGAVSVAELLHIGETSQASARMDLRDWFAGMALPQFVIINERVTAGRDDIPYSVALKVTAEQAYALADAMMAAREKTETAPHSPKEAAE